MNLKCGRNFTFYVILSLYTAVGSVVLYLINVTESSPYIDEIFHVNQCREYCKGSFEKVGLMNET